jgi:hypothetical protein
MITLPFKDVICNPFESLAFAFIMFMEAVSLKAVISLASNSFIA